MKPSPPSHDPAVQKLLAEAEAAKLSPAEGSSSTQHDPMLLKALAEASAWIVTLHGPERTPAVERGFQRWLAESPMHRHAFEHATETWSATRTAVRRSAQVDISAPGSIGERPKRKTTPAVLAFAASLLVAAVGLVLYVQQAELRTSVGERRTVVLEDGTQVTLNTATRMTVDYDKHRRRVRLESGEAFFEVAKRSEWPFVVTANDRDVTALGTSFLVRRDSGRLAVTLLEGKVRITSPVTEGDATASAPFTAEGEATAGETALGVVARRENEPPVAHASDEEGNSSITLVPGQRVVFAGRVPPVLDRPDVQRLTAWQQGLVNIDDLTLGQAAAEMNRYSTLQLVIEGAAADIRVSGVFRVTDSENLARAVALTHGLDMRREDRQIVLSGIPQPPSEARFDPASHKVNGPP